MVKKHCEKHSSFVYNCNECRRANNMAVVNHTSPAQSKDKPQPKKKQSKSQTKSEKVEQPKKISGVKIPIEEDFDEFEDDFEGPEDNGGRYNYRKPPSRRKTISIIAGMIVATIIILIIALYAIPKWYGRISLNNQLYAAKSDISASYWDYYVLNYWSTRFIINKTGLIGGLIGCIVFSIPPETNIFTLISNRLGWRKLTTWKVLVIWWTAGFVIFYLFGQLIDVFSEFSLTIFMIENGDLDISGFFSAFVVLRDPSQLQIVDVFVYTNLFRPIINYLVILIIIRLIISIVTKIFIDFNYYNIAAKGSFIIALLFVMNFFSIPRKAYDGLRLILVWTTPLAIIGFTTLGIFFLIYPRFRENIDQFTREDRKRTIIAVISLIVFLLIPAFISIPTSVKINNDQSIWQEQRWDKRIAVEREWTIQAAGLDMFDDLRSIKNLNESKTGNIVNSIRQYDKEAAIYQMNAYAQTTFEGLADSDIVYVKGKEYWVSPKTLKYEDFIKGDKIKQHTNLFDHVEGFLAIDPFTGELISNQSKFFSIFGVDNSYPIFFGEHEYKYEATNNTLITISSEHDAFDDDILLNTEWINSGDNYNYTYQGEKDGTLTGLSAFWFTLDMGLTSYAFDMKFQKDFLINRNIMTRVSKILLPGLEIDEDPYLVFDYTKNTMYYALSIYTKIPLLSYARSNLLRYIGTVLLDVKMGTLEFVLNPQLETDQTSDPTYPIWSVYLNAYPWESVNSPNYVNWLKEQLRYPESLFESQLQYEYIYHVDDPSTWYGESQFYARPPSGDLFYVRFDLGEGEGLEFVGIDLVQRRGQFATTLAGMYVLRHGMHFGEVIFYSGIEIGETNMIGPNTALQSLIAAATQDLVLIDKKDYGNVLLYPLGTSLYYFIPVYSSSADNRFRVLKIAGFVNAFNALDVAYAESAEEAYKILNLSITEEFQSGNVTLIYEIDDVTILEDILLDIYVKSNDLNFSAPARNVQVNISIESDIVEVFRPGFETLENSTFSWGSGNIGYNFTVFNESLLPLEGFSTVVRLTANLGSVFSATIKYKVVLIVDGVAYIPDFYEFVTFYK
ncbi:MAG: UPF0182 family protein [Candidatus Lokiarchaeota archaeon]|nr:UPF0182 family protein [Candidatus Lokiarchaeota archaeon]